MTSIDHIVCAVADAAERWRNADFPPRVRTTRAIMQRTAYTEPVVDYAVDRLFERMNRATLSDVITGEVGSLHALDRFVERAGKPDVRYRPLRKAVIISSDTTIGVALPACVLALCAQVDVTVKDREDHLVAGFCETVIEEQPRLANSVTVETWSGADEHESLRRLHDAEVVVAYGSDATLQTIRSQIGASTRFVGFGHRTSVGYVAREALSDATLTADTAHGAAVDALLYDGEGCRSLHAVFVERGGRIAADDFARLLSHACDAVAVEFPAGYAQPPADVLIYRNAALFRAALGKGAVYGGTTDRHVIAYDAPREEPPPLLKRTVAVYPVDAPADVSAYLRRHRVPLEAFAYSAPQRSDVVAAAVDSGATAIVPLGHLQAPPFAAEHGGEPLFLPFVRAVYRQ